MGQEIKVKKDRESVVKHIDLLGIKSFLKGK